MDKFPKDVQIEIAKRMVSGTSTTDLRNMLSPKDRNISIITYTDLLKALSIDDVLGEQGKAIILYEITPEMGHWTAIWKDPNNKNTIQQFDSYGLLPDTHLQFIPKQRRAKKKLLKLLVDSKYNVRFNNHILQGGNSIATCGHWVVQRLKMTNLTEDEFAKLFTKSGFDPDFLVTLLSIL